MKAQAMFISGLAVLLIFNVVYISLYPSVIWYATIGALTGFVALILGIGVISGINIFGSGLNSASVKILFGASAILNLLFQINIAGFPVGMGLANNLIFSFGTTNFLDSMGFFLSLIFSVMILASGLVIIQGGAD